MPYKDPVKDAEYKKNYQVKHGAENIRRWRSDPENNAKARKREKDHNRYREDREAFLMRRRLRVYGLTQEVYERMVETQNNQCAICKKQMDSPSIDHNHVTGKNRELLCQQCNTILGMCFENLEILENAISYLKKHF